MSVEARIAHVHVSIRGFETSVNMRRFKFPSPRIQESGHRALAAARPVSLAIPPFAEPPRAPFLRMLPKNTVYRSLALKTVKNVSETDARIS